MVHIILEVVQWLLIWWLLRPSDQSESIKEISRNVQLLTAELETLKRRLRQLGLPVYDY